jgi:GNAT superfamily N-acetyltransferase
MPRTPVSVRRVDETTLDPFVDLWVDHRVENGSSRDVARRLADDGTLRSAVARPDVRIFLGLLGGVPVGYLVLGDTTCSLLVCTPSVTIDMLYVRPEARHHGVGRALLTAAVRYAEQQGVEHVSSAVPAGDRESNRFFARLGFAAETVRRVTTLTSLQRRLAGEAGRHSLEQVIQRRRARDRAAGTRPPRIAG